MTLTFAEFENQLKAVLPTYESRPQQQKLARTVEGHFADHADRARIPVLDRRTPNTVLGQAGCGVGKSFGYMIPAILFAQAHPEQRVIVSVTTKALQDQLRDKDVPFLEKHLGEFSWCVLKGRSNYFCQHLASTADGDLSDLPRVLEFARTNPGWDGTRDGLPFEVDPIQWSKMTSESEACHNFGCKDLFKQGDDSCYAERARSTARASQIVIVNHALFCLDLVLKGMGIPGMLEEYHYFIADEAHELEAVAGETLGARLTEGTFRTLTAEVHAWVHRYSPGDADSLTGALAAISAASQELFSKLPEGRMYEETTLREHGATFRRLVEGLMDLSDGWNKITLDGIPTTEVRKAKTRRDRVSSRIRNATDRVAEVVSDDPDTVRWVEFEKDHRGAKRATIRTAPVSVAPFLRSKLFNVTPSLLVSATLAVKGKFDHITSRLGIDKFSAIDVGTPFNFRTQARLYVPGVHIPDPSPRNKDAWLAAVGQEIVELINAARGRTLVLFTSVSDMNAVARMIRRRVRYTLLVQGDDTVPELTRQFKEDTHSVLFGVKSFFTGFDVQGESLSQVIIPKLPFEVPSNPLFEARCEKIKAEGGNDFEYSMALMSLVLQQGVGRLIRHRDDSGVVAILDRRLVSKGYGKGILRDLPPMPLTQEIEEVVDFLAA